MDGWMDDQNKNITHQHFVVICLGRGADLHMAQLLPLPLTISCFSKSRLVLPEWFCLSGDGLPRLSWKKRPLNEFSSNVVVGRQ